MSNKHGKCFDALTVGEISEAFHVTRRTVNNWILQGCPRNQDKSMSAYQVHNWLLSRQKKEITKKEPDLKDQKTLQEIERLKIQNAKFNDEYIEKSLYDQILSARARSLTIYLERSAVRNTVYYVGKTLEEMQTIRFQEVQEMMKAYVGAR